MNTSLAEVVDVFSGCLLDLWDGQDLAKAFYTSYILGSYDMCTTCVRHACIHVTVVSLMSWCFVFPTRHQ